MRRRYVVRQKPFNALNRSFFQKDPRFLDKWACPWQGLWLDEGFTREISRVAGTTGRVVRRPRPLIASKHALKIIRSGNRQTDRQTGSRTKTDGWTDGGIKPDRRSTRGAEKPCWCLAASDQVEWVVPSCSPSPCAASRLRVYSCKIMPTTPDVPATTPSFDTTLKLRLCGRRISFVKHLISYL